MFFTLSSTYIILTTVYVIVIANLLKSLDKLCQDGMELQTKSVKRQFWFFLVGFLFKTLFYISELWLFKYYYFTGVIILDFISISWNITPIAFVLFEHHRTFKA